MSFWNNVDHTDKEQRNRQKWARDNSRITVKSLDKKNKTCVIEGTSGTYKASLETCTCQDFEQRKLPCKHIYRLAYELGILEWPKKGGYRIPKAEPEKELTRKELGISPGNIFHIEYKGSDGKISERDIEIQKISEVNGKLYIYAYCHMRKTVRSFLATSILSMSYNSRQIKNLKEILEIEYTSPSDLVNKLTADALS